MAKLQLHSPKKTKDFHYIDRLINEFMQISGTIIHIYKFLGIHDQNDYDEDGVRTNPVDHTRNWKLNEDIPETEIQDSMWLENRDRHYSTDVIEMRMTYSPNDQELELSQFGLIALEDTLFLTAHTNDMLEKIGRKLMAGDVLELTHLLDHTALDGSKGPVPKFYVVVEVTRSSEGFSPTWYPHLHRVKIKALADAPEYRDIMEQVNDEGRDLQEIISTFDNAAEITERIFKQAENESPYTDPATDHLYDPAETPALEVISHGRITERLEAGLPFWALSTPLRVEYEGGEPVIRLGSINDEVPATSVFESSSIVDPAPELPLRAGNAFPADAGDGAFFLRTDFVPNRLFQKDGAMWRRVADENRRQWNALIKKYTHNRGTIDIGGEDTERKSSLTKAAKARADQ